MINLKKMERTLKNEVELLQDFDLAPLAECKQDFQDVLELLQQLDGEIKVTVTGSIDSFKVFYRLYCVGQGAKREDSFRLFDEQQLRAFGAGQRVFVISKVKLFELFLININRG